MSNTRKQLFTAVAMLLVAAVALGTATYAWFLNNAAAKVDTMQFQANTASSMEIALGNVTNWTGDAPAYTTIGAVDADGAAGTYWQGLITNSNIKNLYGIDPAASFNTLMPASSAKLDKFFTVNGRENWDIKEQLATTFAAINNFKITGQASGNGNADVIALPLFLRSDRDMNVYLQTTTPGAEVAPLISGGAVAGTLRVAVVPDGETARIFQDPNKHADAPKNTTKGITDSTDPLKAISEVVSGVPTIIAQNPVPVDASVFSVVEGTGENAGFADPGSLPANPLLSLTANTPKKVMVYIWMEGCDYDCVNSVSGQDFSISLNFIGSKPTV